MAQIIAGVYEIEREIGSGGGGVVYIAKHLRLDKKVVLKGDKRSLTANQDMLRREVDSLKNLSHTYIPQVYDYIVDNNMVYTVMDFVDGESLDKALDRQEYFGQVNIVKWARQLLEAVSYLHRQPPHGILHSDIKPANIMLTPQGDIMLIDFNIALMLGEGGAIAVGRSFGYASPEHYGIDHSAGTASLGSSSCDESGNVTTQTLSEFETESGFASASISSSKGSSGIVVDNSHQKMPYSMPGKVQIIIDARSDIYSIGATLYHLVTGKRPTRDAGDIASIIRQYCSAALAIIIEKAMALDPNMRYQSADEMLYDILHLRDNDPRVRKWKRTRSIACVILTCTFLTGGLIAFAGLRQEEQAQRAEADAQRIEADAQRSEADAQRTEADIQRAEALAQQAEAEKQRIEARLQESYVLAANSADALRSGDRLSAIAQALESVPRINDADIPYVAEAKKALADALGIYDLSDGFKAYRTVKLPSEALELVISPDGATFAAMSLGNLLVFDTENGNLIAELPAVESGLANVLYADNNTIVYAAPDGLTAYDLLSKSVVWCGNTATTITVSADGKTIAAVNRDDTVASITSIDGKAKAVVVFGDRHMRLTVNDRYGNPGDNVFALNSDGSLLAVSFSNGGLEIFNVADSNGNIELFDESDYTHFEGGFFGKYFAFSATNAEESLFAVIDVEEFVQTISTSLPARIGIHADKSGVYMSYNGTNVLIDLETAKQTPINYDPHDQIAGGYYIKGNLNSPVVRIFKYEAHEDKEIFAYSSDDVHDEVRLNISGDRIMFFSFDHFRIYDVSGDLVNETAIPDPGYVYDQQYRRQDGQSNLEVTYNDGLVRKYSGDDGTLISEENGSSPDLTLYEQFSTETLRIESPLHGTPAAYDIKTGKLIRELEKDAYLTYVTQAGQYVITEYISADGDRYGLLLDGKTCETLAYIPNLCDVIGERLIIDIRSGSLRETRLYSTDELIEIGRKTMSN